MKKVTKAMVMSAGVGSRLDPLTREVPKPLVPVMNRPVMDILFESLSSIGITDVICNTYYLADQIIERYSKNNPWVNFNYIKETTLSGTAGGVKKCQHFFDKDSSFVVLSADGLTNADILKGIEVHQKSGAIATIGVKRIDKSQTPHFGVVVTDETGFITEFQEKPSVEEAKSDLINTGIYIFDYKIFDYIPEDTFYDFAKNVFPKLLSEKAINTFEVSEYWSDIGTLDQYKQSTKDVFDRKCKFNHSPIIKQTQGSYISENSQIDCSVKFIGNSTIGKNTVIGKNTIIENSIIWDNVKISDNLHIKDCIIGSGYIVTSDMISQIVSTTQLVCSSK